MSVAVAEQIEDQVEETAELPEVETESERIGNAHDLLARYIVGYSVHGMRRSWVEEDGTLCILFATNGAGLTQDLLNLYNTVEGGKPWLMYDLGKVELMLVGEYEDHQVRFYSTARDGACDALRARFPTLGSEYQAVEIEALWAFVEGQVGS